MRLGAALGHVESDHGSVGEAAGEHTAHHALTVVVGAVETFLGSAAAGCESQRRHGALKGEPRKKKKEEKKTFARVVSRSLAPLSLGRRRRHSKHTRGPTSQSTTPEHLVDSRVLSSETSRETSALASTPILNPQDRRVTTTHPSSRASPKLQQPATATTKTTTTTTRTHARTHARTHTWKPVHSLVSGVRL